MRIPGADKAIGNLMDWAYRDEWRPLHDEVVGEHFDGICDEFDIGQEDLAELLGESIHMLYGCAFEDFLTCRFDDDGLNIVDDFLKRRGWREKVPARRYLEALRDSSITMYEVVDLKPGYSLTVRDMIRGGDPLTVNEKLGSESAALWDRIAGRIVSVNGKPYFTGAMLWFPHDVADELLEEVEEMLMVLRREMRKEAKKRGEPADLADEVLIEFVLHVSTRLFSGAWLTDVLERISAPLPQLRNSDGHDLLFSEVRFPMTGDTSAAAARLDETGEFERDDPAVWRWTWHAGASPSEGMIRKTFETDDDTGHTILGSIEMTEDALVLNTNSKERADRGRDLLAPRLEGLVGPPLTSHQTLEQMRDERRDDPPPPADLPPEVAEEALRSFMDRHYRQCLDEPIPYFDGKTPRQATRSKKGRARIVSWLKMLENSEARRASGEGQKPYDFRWMWRELKVEDLR